jgi:hypothetical protein
VFRCRNRAARKPEVAARKNRAKRFAFGLPQDLHMQLMFGPCVKRGSRLSALRGAGFHVERRAAGSARRPRMRRKRLNRRPNLYACTHSCSRLFLKRFHRHGFPRQTKRYEAQNAAACHQFAATCASFGRKTSLVRASFARRLAMRLKRFNDRRFSSRSDRRVLILPQAAQRGLAKKAPLSERLSRLAPCRSRKKPAAQTSRRIIPSVLI